MDIDSLAISFRSGDSSCDDNEGILSDKIADASRSDSTRLCLDLKFQGRRQVCEYW